MTENIERQVHNFLIYSFISDIFIFMSTLTIHDINIHTLTDSCIINIL